MRHAFILFLLVMTPPYALGKTFEDADQLRLRGNYEEALEAYRELRPEKPTDDPKAFVRSIVASARCHDAVGEDARAMELLREHVDALDNPADLWAELGWLESRRLAGGPFVRRQSAQGR